MGQGLPPPYVGRLAPSPTGLLHLGHARTFWIAQQRARLAGGELLLRNDDLDASRCRPEFVSAFREDLAWLGLSWREPMVSQSGRIDAYRAAFERLRETGAVYPCWCSRREVEAAVAAPHEADEQDEPVYPGTCRPERRPHPGPGEANWRLRVPDGRTLSYFDGARGQQQAVAGADFGDFVIWRRDGLPSYQLACAVDDVEMGITEVVRGADLIASTFRQRLVISALGAEPPAYYHCDLMRDERGRRLAKRHDSLSLRELRGRGLSREAVIALFNLS